MYYLADAAIILLVALALILASWWSAHPKRTLLENTVVGAGILLGITGTMLAVRGHFLSLKFGLWPLLFYLLFPLDVSLAQKWRNFQSNARAAWRGVLGLRGVNLFLTLYLLLITALAIVLSLASPNGNDYDSLVYHLAAPQQYLLRGRIVELHYDHHSYFPFLTEMLFALGLHWKGAVLAKLFHWLMLPLSCGVLLAIGQRHFSLRAGLIAACLFASIPIAQVEATTGYVDLSLTAFVALTFSCFLNWLRERDGWWLAWSGVFCGFALGVKYSGALYLGWLIVWVIGSFVFKPKSAKPSKGTFDFAGTMKALCALCLPALLVGGGWYLRNWLWTGNPVFPFAYEIFGGKGWTLEMARAYTRDQAMFGFGRSVSDLLWLPWRAAMAPLNFGMPFWPLASTPLDNGAAGRFEVPAQVTQTFIGPPLLAFSLPLFFIKRKPQTIGFLLWTYAALWIFWAVTSQQLRYLLPSLTLLCVCCGWGVLQLSERSTLLKWTGAITLATWLTFVPIHTLHRLRYVLPVVIGAEQPEDFLIRSFPGYSAMQWANKNTPRVARFAVYGEPRCFYLEREYFWADDPHNNLIDYWRFQTVSGFVYALRRLGANYVLWNTDPEHTGGFGSPPPQLEMAINEGRLKLLFESRGYRIYRISY